MAAVLGGAGASLAWAIGALCAARCTRAIGPLQTLAWVMAFGLAMLVPLLALSDTPEIDGSTGAWLAISGAGNVAGLLMVYRALSIGQIGVVSPIVSAEGAVAAVLAIIGGQGIDAARTVALIGVVAGVMLVARRPTDGGETPVPPTRAAAWAAGAAVTFGFCLYATGRAAADVPAEWAVLPPRLIGVLVITLPLVVRGRLPRPGALTPLLALTALCEVAGFLCFALGAAHDIAIAAVLAGTTGATAAALAWAIHTERLTRLQVGGVALLTASVAAITALAA